jgi:transposase-like protein
MTKPIARDPIYRRRVFDAEIIELCVRWYITYRLSYRDLVAMMAERGVILAHSTILRWVTRYVPEYERRWNRCSRSVGTSWRTDETCISIRGKWHYLYQAVDKRGKTVDFLLRRDRGIAAAQAFFRKALATNLNRWPRKVMLVGYVPSHRALRLLRREDSRWRNVEVRTCKYLKNIVEQDHRAIKRRCASMAGFKSFDNAAITLAGIELAHRIHKRQFSIWHRPTAPRAVVKGGMGSGPWLRPSIAKTRFRSSCVAAAAPEPLFGGCRRGDPMRCSAGRRPTQASVHSRCN